MKRHPAATCALAMLVLVAGLGGFLGARWPELVEARRVTRERDHERLLDTAWLRLGEERFDEAAQLFAQARRGAPQSPAALAGHILSLVSRGEEAVAWTELENAPRLVTSSGPLRMLRDELRRIQGEDVQRKVPVPESSLGWFLKGWIRILHARTGRLGLWKKAIEDLSRAILDPEEDRASYYFALATAMEHLDQPRRADWLADLMLRRWPDSVQARYWAARALTRSHPEKSLRLLLELCEKHEDHVGARLAAAKALLGRREQIELVDRLLEEARRLDPETIETRRLMVLVLDWKGQIPEACRAARALVQDHPENGKLWQLLGSLLLRAQRLDEAREALRKATRFDPLHWQGHDNLGRALAFSGEVEAALAAFERASRLEPLAFAPHCNRGLSLLAMRRDEESREALRRAHSLKPTNMMAAQALARALWLGGDPRSGLAVLETAEIPADDPWQQRIAAACQLEREGLPAEGVDTRSWSVERRLLLAVALEARGAHRRAVAAWSQSPWSGGNSPADAPRYRAALCLLRMKEARAADSRGRSLRRRALRWLDQAREAALASKVTPPGAPARVFAQAVLHEPALTAFRRGEAQARLPADEQAEWSAFFEEISGMTRPVGDSASSPPDR